MKARAPGDPVPAIKESDAVGEIASLYADIRISLGTSSVNLIWRHLATFPGALPWCWTTIKPLLQSDLLVAMARDFRSGLKGPTLPEMPAEVREIFGLKMADIDLISSTLRGYYNSCTMNVLSLNALLLLMDNRGPMDTALTSPNPAPSGRQELLVENMARLLDPSEMHSCVADLAWRLNAEGDSDDERVLKSLYRYLANWPVFLGAVWALVTPLADSGELKRAVTDCLRDADVYAQRLAATLNPSQCPLDESTQHAVREALVEFARNAIPKSIPVTRALMRVVGTRVDS